MCCDKSEIIRILSRYLRETQAQYNDCFSEAAEQGTLLELQREAVQNLQGTIVRKELVYYSLLIKTQELFRDRIEDVRAVKSKIHSLVKSKRYLEDKCRRIKRLWQDADWELRKIKSTNSYDPKSRRKSRCRDCSTWTDTADFGESLEMRVQVNFLLRENEDLKKQLCNRGLELELFDEEVKEHIEGNNRDRRETENCCIPIEEFTQKHCVMSTGTLEVNIDGSRIKDELGRRNVELDKMMNEARDKQQELEMLQDMRKEFERTEYLERMNECLTKELTMLRQTVENETRDRRENFTCHRAEHPSEKEIEMIRKLRDQLSSTRELTEECLAELRASKDTLCFLRERVCSLKRMLKEKSDEMASLQADHLMIKNDYSILKTENRIFEEKARAGIGEFREKLKDLHSELRLVDDNYQRVTQDLDKCQALLIEAARREVNLQHAITAMEQMFDAKLASAENEGKRLSDLVDRLRADLVNAREELSTREADFTEKCGDAYARVETLEERVVALEDAKRRLTRELIECRSENCSLIEDNNRLMTNGCRCAKELEDTHNALLELKGECKTKSRTLNTVSAELCHVAASRSELCDESQRVVACIRTWVEEQRRLVETLSKRLKDEKNRIAQFAFEKKALVATVKELSRLNGRTSAMKDTTRKRFGQPGHSPIRRSSRNTFCQAATLCYPSKRDTPRRAQQSSTASGSTVHTRPSKRRCVCRTRNARRTMPHGNSWWFPKLERTSNEFCCRKRRYEDKIAEDWQSETSIDETRDFGYQSSASK